MAGRGQRELDIAWILQPHNRLLASRFQFLDSARDFIQLSGVHIQSRVGEIEYDVRDFLFLGQVVQVIAQFVKRFLLERLAAHQQTSGIQSQRLYEIDVLTAQFEQADAGRILFSRLLGGFRAASIAGFLGRFCLESSAVAFSGDGAEPSAG